MERKIDRFLQYLEYKGITENKATVDCGLSKGLIGQAKNGKSDLGSKAVEKVLMFYQDINKVWLITGEGDMLNTQTPAESPEEKSTTDRLFALIDDQREEIKMLLELLKMKDEKIDELRRELDARKEKTAHNVDSSSSANVG